MANIKYYSTLDDYRWIPDLLQSDDKGQINTRTATRFAWTDSSGNTTSFIGNAMTYADGDAAGGKVTGVQVKNSAGQLLFSITGLSVDFQDIFTRAFGFDRFDQNRQNPDGFSLLTHLLRGADTITGSGKSDDIIGGRNPGNDKINAAGGDDFIKGDAGNDKIDGGADFDTLSYQETFYDDFSFKGVNINLITRKVQDSWGGTDTFSNIEQFRGSKFADTFTGDRNDNEFMGLRGNDKITGGAGFDFAVYANDDRFGGSRGINANLATNKVKDGFGNTDTLSGVEGIVGTRDSDTFTGNGADNEFSPGGGNDTINGGGGSDYLALDWWENELNGAIVDLNLTSGQIVNDGYGGTDTIASIETIDGTRLSDNFTGDGARNRFRGNSGEDVINGGGGNDFIRGDQGADILTGGAGADEFGYQTRRGETPWGDTITDFEKGVDKITFSTRDFAGMGTTKRFVNDDAAGGTGSWFYFNAADQTLYWDRDGTGAGAAVAVAKLQGINSLSASDFELFS